MPARIMNKTFAEIDCNVFIIIAAKFRSYDVRVKTRHQSSKNSDKTKTKQNGYCSIVIPITSGYLPLTITIGEIASILIF